MFFGRNDMKKRILRVGVILLIALIFFDACVPKIGETPPEGSGKVPVEDRDIEQLSQAVDVILEDATSDFIGKFPVTDGFFYWVAKEYGDDCIFEIVKNGDVSNKEIWYELTGNSIYVLWQKYCESTGLGAYEYSHTHEVSCENEKVFSIDFCGDINMCEEAATTIYMDQQPNGILDCFSKNLLEEMQGVDLFVANNEFSYTTRGEALEGKAYTFRANPDRVQSMIDIGTDLVTLANNHVWDYGLIGLTDTLETVQNSSLEYVGAGYNLNEAKRAQYYIANGRKIAVVNATQIERSYGYTKQATDDTPGVLKTLDPTLFCEAIATAKKQSDLVIVCVHWGTEGNNSYAWDQVKLADAFIAAGADAIIGGHTHCLQGIEYMEDVPIYYSLGNYWFATTANMPADYDTALARLEISNDLSITAKVIPCKFSKGVTSMLEGDEAKFAFAQLDELSKTVTISNDGVVNKE